MNCYNAPYGPISIQFGEVAFSAPYSSIWIKFVEVHLDPCAFDYTKFDDWFKLTPPFGLKLHFEDFEPLVAMLFYQLTSSYLSS